MYGGADIGSSNGRFGGEFVGKIEVSPLGEFLGADGGYDIGNSDGMSGEKFYGNIEVYPLGY